MVFKLDYTLVRGALKVTMLALVLSLVTTAIATYLTTNSAEELERGLKLGLSIGTLIPILVALPISYYVMQQRQKIRIINEKLIYLIRFDQLTSLLSRRAFFQEVETALERLQGGSQPNAVFFIDLDHFKQVNDQFGHAIGDKVLKILGTVMNDYLKPGEIAGRMGGEEFCMFVQNCPPDMALARAQKLVDEFRHQARIVDGKEVGCTMSIGVAVSADTDDLDNLLGKADRLLYIAKQHGRDCVALENDLQVAA